MYCLLYDFRNKPIVIDDVDSIGLTNMVARLNHGLDIGGQSLGGPARFHIGVAVNPAAPNPDGEWRRLDYKVEAGAEFILTPPVLDVDAFLAILPRLTATGLPVIVGIVPIESLRQLEFIASEAPDVRVPDAAMARMRVAADPEAEGMRITLDVFHALRPAVQGVSVRPLHGSPESVERFLRTARG